MRLRASFFSGPTCCWSVPLPLHPSSFASWSSVGVGESMRELGGIRLGRSVIGIIYEISNIIAGFTLK